MPLYSVLQDSRLNLTRAYVYRARMLIKAPGIVATEGKVSDALAEQGFANVTFFDKSKLPVDWPADQRADESGAFSWTAFLQGTFALTDRTIPLADLPGTVEVLGMWTHLVPVQPIPGMPAPGPTDLHLAVAPDPSAAIRPSDLSFGIKVGASLLGMLAAYCLLRTLVPSSSSGRRTLLA